DLRGVAPLAVSALSGRSAPRARGDPISGRAAGAAPDRPRVSHPHWRVHTMPPPRPGPPPVADLRGARRRGRATGSAGGRARRLAEQALRAALREDRRVAARPLRADRHPRRAGAGGARGRAPRATVLRDDLRSTTYVS